MKPSAALANHRETLRAMAASHGLKDVRVFGSTARGEDQEGSDLDLLVTLERDDQFFAAIDLIVAIKRFDAGVTIDAVVDMMIKPAICDAAKADGIPL